MRVANEGGGDVEVTQTCALETTIIRYTKTNKTVIQRLNVNVNVALNSGYITPNLPHPTPNNLGVRQSYLGL
jgi:hypothetical protein